MKKLLLTLTGSVVAIGLSAQTDQGGWMFGAGSDLGFTSSKQDNDQDDAQSDFDLDVRAGYFLIDNFAAGLDIAFSSSKLGDATESSVLVGPYVRYYLPMKIFGEVSAGFGSTKSEQEVTTVDPITFEVSTSTEEVKYGQSAIGIGVGYAAFLTDNISIEPMLKYSITSLKPDEGDSVSGSGFGITIGFGIYLGQ